MSHIPSQWILDLLKSKGQKITAARKKVAAYIVDIDGLFSAKEILSAVPTMDRVTVYRVLDVFESLDIIHAVLTHHGETHYELHGEHHHHHIVCTRCKKTSCVECTITRKEISGFSNIHHSVVFTGLCNTCNI